MKPSKEGEVWLVDVGSDFLEPVIIGSECHDGNRWLTYCNQDGCIGMVDMVSDDYWIECVYSPQEKVEYTICECINCGRDGGLHHQIDWDTYQVSCACGVSGPRMSKKESAIDSWNLLCKGVKK